MKRQFRLLLTLVTFFFAVMISSVSGQAPPPPGHSLNGNQPSPGGTGCPVDRNDALLLVIAASLGYAGYALFQRRKNEAVK